MIVKPDGMARGLGRLPFPTSPETPGVYRFELSTAQGRRLYVGETRVINARTRSTTLDYSSAHRAYGTHPDQEGVSADARRSTVEVT